MSQPGTFAPGSARYIGKCVVGFWPALALEGNTSDLASPAIQEAYHHPVPDPDPVPRAPDPPCIPCSPEWDGYLDFYQARQFYPCTCTPEQNAALSDMDREDEAVREVMGGGRP